MKLFSCQETKLDSITKVIVVKTPLGSVVFDAIIGEKRVSDVQPDEICNGGNDAHLFEWQISEFDLNLLICRPNLDLPNGMKVDDCWAGMWRLKANSIITASEFSCTWSPGYKWVKAAPNTGENLSAWIWNDQDYQVHIGTEDEVGFVHRAKAGMGMPTRFARNLTADSKQMNEITRLGGPINLSEQGLTIHLPELRTDELYQIHFVVAWSAYSEDDASTLFAVDCPPDDILAGAGCM